MQLPGRAGRPIATHKVSIGEFADGRPQKDDKFTIRQFDQAAKRWKLNPPLQKRLQAKLEEIGAPKPEQPTWVPVLTPYQTPQEAVFSELAMWAAGRYVCHCTQFALKTPETCQDQGLAWPIPGGEDNAGTEYYVGAAVRNYWKKKGKGHELRATETVTCDPANCPFARAFQQDDMALYEQVYGRANPKTIGYILCKPHTVVPLILPWVGSDSPRAKFTTSAWSTSRALLRTLDEIHTATGGVLCGLPLRLVLKWHQQQTPMGAQWNPVVEFEPMVDWNQLALIAGEHAKMLAQNVHAQAHVQAQLKMLKGVTEEGEDEAWAFQQEFGAGVIDEQPFGDQTEARFRELAGRCKWTKPETDKFIDEGTDNDIYEQVGAFERELGIVETPEPERVDLSEVDPEEDPFPESPEAEAAKQQEANVGADGQAELEV